MIKSTYFSPNDNKISTEDARNFKKQLTTFKGGKSSRVDNFETIFGAICVVKYRGIPDIFIVLHYSHEVMISKNKIIGNGLLQFPFERKLTLSGK